MAGYIGYKRTIQLDFNYDAVKQGVPKVNQQMALLNSEFNKTSAVVKASGSAFDMMALNNQKCAAQVQVQKEKVAQLEKELQKLNSAENKNQRAITSKTIELNNAKAKLIDYQTALNKSNKDMEKSNTLFGTAKLAIEDFKLAAERAGVDLKSLGGELAALTGAVTAFTTVTGKAFMDYEGDITLARNLMDESQMSFEELDNGVRQIADDYGLQAAAAARAAEAALSSNVQTADSLDFLSKSAKFAVATTSELAEANERMLTATDIGTSIMNAYKLSVEDMDGVFDELIKTQKMAKVTWEDYNSQIGNLVAIGGQWGVSLEEINASLIMQTRCGIDSATALTNTKNILAGIINPSNQASEAAEQLGIDFGVTALKSKGFAQILMEVISKTEHNSAAVSQLFGNIRGLTGVTVNASEKGKMYKEVMKELADCSGSLDENFKNVTDTTNYKFDSAMNNLSNSMIDLGEAIAPVIEKVADIINWIADLPTPVLEGAAATLGLIAAWKIGSSVVKVFGEMLNSPFKLLGKISEVMGVSTAVTTANTAATSANSASMAAQGTAAAGAATALGTEATAAGAASAANSTLTATGAAAGASLAGVGSAGAVAGTGLMTAGAGGTMALGPMLLLAAAVAVLVILFVKLGRSSSQAKSSLSDVRGEADAMLKDVQKSASQTEKMMNKSLSSSRNAARTAYATGTNYAKEDGWYTVNDGNETEEFVRRGTQIKNAAQTRRDNSLAQDDRTTKLLETLINEVATVKSTISNLPSEQLRLSRM